MAKTETSMDGTSIKEQLHQPSIFRNEKYLDRNYVPDRLYYRDDAIKSLIHCYKKLLTEGIANSTTLILGATGSGKTTIVKFFLKYFREVALKKFSGGFNTEYFNCVQYRTQSAIVRELSIRNLYETGVGHADETLWHQLLTKLHYSKEYLFIVLDEVHVLPSDAILDFLNLSETFGHQNARISVLLTTRFRDWTKVENEKILSRLNDIIVLNDYTREEVYEILRRRAESSFIDNAISNEVLLEISNIVVRTKNMRHGIEILRKIGEHADKNGLKMVPKEFVSNASKFAYSKHRAEIIDRLTMHEIFTLLALIRAIKKNSINALAHIAGIYSEYKQICCSRNIEPHVITALRRHIQILESANLISSKSVRTDTKKRGRHKIVKLSAPFELGIADLESELEAYIKRRYDS